MKQFYTNEQKRDWLRTQRYIKREQLRSVMNDTKWSEAIEALDAIPNFRISFRAKTLREEAPRPGHWEGFFPLHVPTREYIEWLEIDPIQRIYGGALVDDVLIDRADEVMQALRAVHVPFSREGTAIRIWGYTRPGANPEFV
jgi:hypothetical protein